MADKIATLHLPGKDPVELPILSGTIGPDVIDVRKLEIGRASCRERV